MMKHDEAGSAEDANGSQFPDKWKKNNFLCQRQNSKSALKMGANIFSQSRDDTNRDSQNRGPRSVKSQSNSSLMPSWSSRPKWQSCVWGGDKLMKLSIGRPKGSEPEPEPGPVRSKRKSDEPRVKGSKSAISLIPENGSSIDSDNRIFKLVSMCVWTRFYISCPHKAKDIAHFLPYGDELLF